MARGAGVRLRICCHGRLRSLTSGLDHSRPSLVGFCQAGARLPFDNLLTTAITDHLQKRQRRCKCPAPTRSGTPPWAGPAPPSASLPPLAAWLWTLPRGSSLSPIQTTRGCSGSRPTAPCWRPGAAWGLVSCRRLPVHSPAACRGMPRHVHACALRSARCAAGQREKGPWQGVPCCTLCPAGCGVWGQPRGQGCPGVHGPTRPTPRPGGVAPV